MVFGQFYFRSCSQNHIFIVFLFKAEKKSSNFTVLKEPLVMDSAVPPILCQTSETLDWVVCLLLLPQEGVMVLN